MNYSIKKLKERMNKNIEKNKDIILLAIETSCDETSIAIVKNGREVLSNKISSQIDIHRVFGGVVPEVASRNHLVKIPYIIDEAIEQSGIHKELDGIAVTYGHS